MFDYQPPPAKLDIVYYDSDLLVVNKPADLLSVPGRRPEHQDCLITRVQQEYPTALIVHRLDMSTSGLLVIALNPAAHRHLNKQFELRQVQKTYLAVVTGQVATSSGQIDLPLSRDWPNRPRQIVDHSHGKASRTDYRVLNYDPATNCTRIELKPVTGRTHQLRVHMLALGHPILGDDLYADQVTLKAAPRLLLHATCLCLTQPTTLEPLVFTRDAPF